MKPTSGQLLLLMASVAFFALSGLISIARLWWDRNTLRVISKSSLYWGTLVAVVVIFWHSASRGQWQPMKDNFESLIWLAVLLALFLLYMQRIKPIRGLDWFVMPVIILLLTSAALFGRWDFREYAPVVSHTWLWVHHVSAYGGTVAFAVAAAGGAMYVITSRRLRSKSSGITFGSLERLEHLMMTSVTLGFALLTVGLITGIGRMLENDSRPPTAKIVFASAAWLVYAVVMHAPINPRFRGRRAAVLSVFGFLLMIGTLVAVQFMPGGKS